MPSLDLAGERASFEPSESSASMRRAMSTHSDMLACPQHPTVERRGGTVTVCACMSVCVYSWNVHTHIRTQLEIHTQAYTAAQRKAGGRERMREIEGNIDKERNKRDTKIGNGDNVINREIEGQSNQRNVYE